MKILVIEPQESARKLLAEVLAPASGKVVATVEAAETLLATATPRAILVAITSPDCPNARYLRSLMARPEMADVHFAAITAMNARGTLEASESLHVPVLQKPATLPEMMDVVR